MKIIPVILSGGSGTRLWPLSRESNPKQFLKLFGEHSLFQKTALRTKKENDTFLNPIVICNQEHRFVASEELRQIGVTPQSIILEPVGRNTAPAIAVAALTSKSPEDLLLVMPSDHIILDEKEFITHVKISAKAALEDYLVTFGIVPNKAETGYGYIKCANKLGDFDRIFAVENFIEKPKKEVAEGFIQDKNYLWNSGIFMFKASTYLNAIQSQKEILTHCQIAYNNAVKDLDFIRLDKESFEKCEKISIDYAVMEKSKNIAVVPINVGWSDVGSWSAISEITDQDENKNSVIGDVIVMKTNNCYINSSRGIVATIGVKDLIIINLKDAVLIANKNNAQDVKELFETLKNQKREECNTHAKVLRPWGSFEVIDFADRFKAKRITVKPGASLSLQMHNHRAEHWVVVRGIATVTCNDKEFLLNEDQSTYIPLTTKHRLENKGTETLEIIEIQTGHYLGEDDIVRFSDVYGR